MSFRLKTILILLTAILLPSLLLSILVYVQAEKSVTQQTARDIIVSLNRAVAAFDSDLRGAQALFKLMRGSEAFTRALENAGNAGQNEKNAAYSELYKQLVYSLQRIKAPNTLTGINSLYLYAPKNNTVFTTDTTYYEAAPAGNISFLKDGRAHTGAWYASAPVNFYTLNGIAADKSFLTLNMDIYDDFGELAGVLALNLNIDVLSAIYDRAVLNAPGAVAVYGEDGQLLYGENLAGISLAELEVIEAQIRQNGAEKYFITSGKDGARYLVAPYRSSQTGWTYAAIVNTSNFLGALYETKRVLILLIILMITATPMISIAVTHSVLKPANKLVGAMQEVKSRNLKVRINDPRTDEYQKIFTGFNDMIAELNRLMTDLTNEKALNKEAQIRLLQEQINPHFLYNTLDSIYSIASIENVPKIANLALSLSHFFRVSLSEGKDVVPLSQAVSIVRHYLDVQNVRFNEKFNLNVTIPEKLLSCRVPKLLLQPLVENAVRHGLEAKKGAGHIHIFAFLAGNDIKIGVQDDGIGIMAQKLEQINAALTNAAAEGNGAQGHFAVKNINTQLKLKYGDRYGISISAAKNRGTLVLITMPAEY